eukprot:285734-Alexandrium_andersonii.AAC.1
MAKKSAWGKVHALFRDKAMGLEKPTWPMLTNKAPESRCRKTAPKGSSMHLQAQLANDNLP